MPSLQHSKIAAFLAAGVLVLTPIAAATAAEMDANPNDTAAVKTKLPQPEVEGAVTYITGGFGDEERAAIKQSDKNYNLRITNADETGAFAGKGSIVIIDSNGETVLSTDMGPLFSARLPAGKYAVEATMDEQKIVKQVTISPKHASNLDLKWHS